MTGDGLVGDDGSLHRRTVAGVRWAIFLNFGALPLSFVTNMILGRVGPEALGAYGAVQVLIGTSFTFLVFGGGNVFTRFVPALPQQDRLAFLASYGVVVGTVFFSLAAAAFLAPDWAGAALAPLGSPSVPVVVGLLAASLVSGMCCWFLYASSEPTWAVLSEKLIVVGFFVAGLLALGTPREALSAGDASFLWTAALAVHVASALLAGWRVSRTEAFATRRIRIGLPRGFWPVAGYTHVETVVSYVHATLAPSIVLLWVDMEALGYLHAALRYVVLMTALPAAVISVLGPQLRRLAASGLQDEALRQTSAAIRVCLLALGPAALVLIAFAEDAMALFGPGFREHADVLRLAAPAVLATPVVLCGAGAALAIGSFAAYLRASLGYVAIATLLIAAVVPVWGVLGAAAAMSLGALARQIAITLVLRRDGFRSPGRLNIAWFCAGGILAAMILLHPGRLGAAVLLAIALTGFAAGSGVRAAEVRQMVRMALGRG